MSTVEITRVEDVRAGDFVRLAYRGHEFSGVAWSHNGRSDSDNLKVGAVRLDWASKEYSGAYDSVYDFLGATREVPDLPTEPGSVIVNATIRGVEGQTAIRLGDINWVSDINWVTTTPVEGYWYHDPEHITAWEPARIVPEGGAS